MNREVLQKFYPAIIVVAVLVTAIGLYFAFFSGSYATKPPHLQLPLLAPGTYPTPEAEVTVDGTAVPLQKFRDQIKAPGDEKEIAAAVNILGDAHDLMSVPQLIILLDSKEALIRGRAAVALQKIFGKEFNYSAAAPEKDRKAIVAQMKAEYDRLQATRK